MISQKNADLLHTLQVRFDANMQRHESIDWPDVLIRIERDELALKVLHAMEATCGEPDVIDFDAMTRMYTFCDCSPESPSGRRSLCYVRQALDSRKEHKPAGCVIDMAAAIGIELLTEQEYRMLQKLGQFDMKTSSWIQTKPEIRQLGGALFCDRRYNHVFVYHNGAQSYYASRGFRGVIRI